MPYRGRDTYYLELFMAAMSLSMAVMCLFYAGRFATLVFLNHSNMRVPVWLWAMLWITSSAMMSAGVLLGREKIAEWGALYTASLWFVVLYASLTSRLLFPMSSAVSPVFVAFNAMIYGYRARVGRYHQHGRLSTHAR
jgi:hypothetical protein